MRSLSCPAGLSDIRLRDTTVCERTSQLFWLQIDVTGYVCIQAAIVTEETMYSDPQREVFFFFKYTVGSPVTFSHPSSKIVRCRENVLPSGLPGSRLASSQTCVLLVALVEGQGLGLSRLDLG